MVSRQVFTASLLSGVLCSAIIGLSNAAPSLVKLPTSLFAVPA